MEDMDQEDREYEALAVMRDVALLLYSEISENTGDGCRRLRMAFEYLDRMTEEAGKGRSVLEGRN